MDTMYVIGVIKDNAFYMEEKKEKYSHMVGPFKTRKDANNYAKHIKSTKGLGEKVLALKLPESSSIGGADHRYWFGSLIATGGYPLRVIATDKKISSVVGPFPSIENAKWYMEDIIKNSSVDELPLIKLRPPMFFANTSTDKNPKYHSDMDNQLGYCWLRQWT